MKSLLLFWFLSLITSILTAILETCRLIIDALKYDRTDLKKLPAHVSLYLARPTGFDELEYFIRALVFYNPKMRLLSIFIKEGHLSKDGCAYMETLKERLKSISHGDKDVSDVTDRSGLLNRKGFDIVLLHPGDFGIEQTLERYLKLTPTKRKAVTVQSISDWQRMPDPDLLIVSGSSQCLQLGDYPFWSLRLCEIRFVPWFFSLSSIIVRASLYSFSNADQRIGRLSKKFLEENKMILNKTNYYVFPLQKAPERWRLEPFVKDGAEYQKRGIFQDIIAQIKQSINLKLNTDALTLQTDLSQENINLGAAISLSTFFQVLNGLQVEKSEDSDFNFNVPVVIPTGDPNAPVNAFVNPDALFGRRLMQVYYESFRELRKNDQKVEAIIERVYPTETRWNDARLFVTAYRKGEPQQMKMRFLHNEIKYVVENSSSEKDSAVIEVDVELLVDLKFNIFDHSSLVNTEVFKKRPIIVTLKSNNLDVDVKPQSSLKLKDMIKWTMTDIDYVVASTIAENKKAGAQFSPKAQ